MESHMAEASTDRTTLGAAWVIEPRREGLMARLRDVWKYRRLMLFFAVRAFERMYAGTILGRSWILIRALLPLAVQTLVFGGVLGVGSQGVPYFLFVSVGTTAWDLFAQATMWGTRSLQMNRAFLTRIYIPRLILPIATMSPAIINFVIHIAVVAGAILYYRITRGVWFFTPLNLGWALFAILLVLVLALGIALWTSVPALVARDVRFTLGYVLGFWLFLTPVLYPLPRDAKYGWLLSLNPMSAIVTAFKHGTLGLGAPRLDDLGIALLVIAVVLGSGLWFFSRAEGDAADKV
jgi:lipopolysaccharide transport system permease protein